MADILNFDRNKQNQVKEPPKPAKYEIHLFSDVEVNPQGEERLVAEGFLRFSPMFVCVADTPDDASASPVLTVPANLVRYIKRIDDEETIQATLSL